MTMRPYFRTIDLNGVPFPDFVEEFSYEEIRAEMIAHLLRLQPDYIVLESDPAIKVIEACAYREMLLRQRINDAALGNTITQAQGNDLEVIGAFVGVKKLEGEDMERFRSRVQQGLTRLAAAGPRNAYISHAMDVSTNIIHVGVHSPTAGEVVVTLLAFEDVDTASEEELKIGLALFAQPQGKKRILARSGTDIVKKVRDRLNENDLRPLTDIVTVRPANIKTYNISARLVIYPGPDASVVKNEALKRLATYLQSIRKVDYDATQAGIIAALHAPGVQNVLLQSPLSDVDCGPYDVAAAVKIDVEVERVDV